MALFKNNNMINVSYQKLIDLIEDNSLFFYYEDDENLRYVIARLNRDICYLSSFELVEIPDPELNPEQYDFEENWKHLAGYGDYCRMAWMQTMPAAQVTPLNIKIQKDGIDTDAFVFKGKIRVDENAAWQDCIKIKAIDIDNILGYGENTVLQELV